MGSLNHSRRCCLTHLLVLRLAGFRVHGRGATLVHPGRQKMRNTPKRQCKNHPVLTSPSSISMTTLAARGCCGRVARLPHRLSLSHGLRSSCRNIQPVANYHISLLPRIFPTVYSCTHYFPPFMLPDSLHSCASVFDLIPLSS
jgi:hypothetical protein